METSHVATHLHTEAAIFFSPGTPDPSDCAWRASEWQKPAKARAAHLRHTLHFMTENTISPGGVAYMPTAYLQSSMPSSPVHSTYAPSIDAASSMPRASIAPSTPRIRSPPLSVLSSPRATDWRYSRDSLAATAVPYTKEYIENYRRRIKDEQDAEALMVYALYLIEAAKRTLDPHDSEKQARKYREALLSESVKIIKKLATSGAAPGKPPYADAQFYLANCYGNGKLGMSIDHAKSYHLYVQASKQNHPAATYRTAVCNEVGAGTKRNPKLGVLFYRKAASLGDTAGMYKLGMILLYGLLEQHPNPREAIVWLKRAADQADEDNPCLLYTSPSPRDRG